MRKFNRLIWDIEVSPNIGLFWRASRKQFIPYSNIVDERKVICIAYKWEGSNKVSSLRWDNGDDEEMLNKFMPVLQRADEAVAHNGDRFDMRFFRGRCLYHGIVVPPDVKTVDTYVIAKRRFDLNSNSLAYLAKYLKLPTEKDHMEYEDWIDITLYNNKPKLRKMVDYCKKDVDVLEGVWNKLSYFHNAKTHIGVFSGNDKWSCQHCGSEEVRCNKTRYTTYGTPKHEMLCKCCGKYYTICHTALDRYHEEKRRVA